MKNFAGRVAVITGAGSGMGRALALALAERGAHLAIADVDRSGLAGTAEQVTERVRSSGSPRRCTIHPVDVADREAVSQFAADVMAQHGAVHLVFNNAGVSVTGEVRRLDYADMHWLMDINFWGVVHGCKAFLPHLLEADAGHIVNTASVFGLMSVPGQSLYNASKFAVKGFTDALHQELADTHVRVSCVLPGGVKTNIVRTSRYVPSDNEAPGREELEARFEQLARRTPAQAAEEILRGVECDKARILVGRDARFISALVRLLPVRYMRLMKWAMERDEARQRRHVPSS
jgi:NAD(P)-dependent dehydrogenase (short-subunit alcohol dehydrogenase family)